MKHLISIIGVLFLMIIFSAAPASAKKLKVVTSLPSLASITESIGGEYVDVTSISRGMQDAHYIEAKPSYMVKLSKADLLIYSGMELEIGWLPLLIQGSRNSRVAVGSRGSLNASIAIPEDEILEKPRGGVDRTMGDVHPMGNPHYILDPRKGLMVSELIAQKLCELDPNHRADYEKNLAAFQSELEGKMMEWGQTLAPLQDMEVVTYHPHWTYVLDWLGMETAGYIELRPGIPPTPKHKKEVEELMRIENIPMVIVSSWKEPRKARDVAAASGAELVILPGEVQALPGTDDYISAIDYMVNELAGALSSISSETEE
jgi:ABC-type Zn uptake system ZnuABC Zn-binding protein ZnuA